jgi:hypothetical protein
MPAEHWSRGLAEGRIQSKRDDRAGHHLGHRGGLLDAMPSRRSSPQVQEHSVTTCRLLSGAASENRAPSLSGLGTLDRRDKGDPR